MSTDSRAWPDDCYCDVCGRLETMNRKRETVGGKTLCGDAICRWNAKGWFEEDEDFRRIVAEVVVGREVDWDSIESNQP